MTLSSFATEAGHVPHSASAAANNASAAASAVSAVAVGSAGAVGGATTDVTAPPPPPPAATTTANAHNSAPAEGAAPSSSLSSSPSHKNNANILHTHRQNHNSSKLPAFRFADLKKESLTLPSLLQQIPPSPVSPPNSAQTSPDSTDGQQNQQHHHQPSDLQDVQQSRQSGPSNPATTTVHNNSRIQNPALPASPPSASASASSFSNTNAQPSPVRSRASTFQTPSKSTQITPSTTARRPASFPDSPTTSTKIKRTLTDPNPTTSTASAAAAAAKSQRRAPASFSSGGLETANGPPSALSTKRLHAVQAAQSEQATDATTKEWAQGQRELILPKSIHDKSADDKRKSTSRPPVSFRPPRNDGASSRAVIPPIRSFRSSGSRKSLVLDMNIRSQHSSDDGDAVSDPNHRDRTLRALEGRADDDYLQMTPPDSAGPTPEGENTADLFMSIAREDPTRRPSEDDRPVEDQSAVSRTARTFQRRPFSVAIPSHQATSPPQVTRRLSDQRENSRLRRLGDDQSAQQMTRELASRALSKEKPGAALLKSETPRSRTVGSTRPSPNTTPRSVALQDASSETAASYAKRRSSITEGNSGLPTRTTSYKSTYGLPRNYNSSPLVPRHADPQRLDGHELNHGLEGTESTASTAAPSTVWDELDDLKSRMRRLELTGKIPPTSGAAMSRVSDDRPPTATTNATTMSGSPKRTSGNAQPETSSNASSQRESQPILRSALSQAKPYLSQEVYEAIDSAATDALVLSQMVGVAGQPGPISSGASTIGTGAAATVTDRQLRRKAESICRSLTELCIALRDEGSQQKTVQVSTPREDALPSPTTAAGFSGLTGSRRPTAIADSGLAKINTSPRSYTRLEDRRSTFINSPALPSPRFALAPNTPTDNMGRRSSLLVSRTRRAGTEEPEEMSGRKSSLLRTRRAGTEEPEEGRKSSLLLRSRRAFNDEDEDESRFRAPSRAVTEVAALRTAPREYQSQVPAGDAGSLASSALPRRRLVPSSLNSRLVAPSTTTTAAGGRRYLDRSTPERETNSVVEKLAEERGQRQLSLGQTAMLNRTGSLNRRVNRESAIPSLSSTASQVGGYR